MNKLKHYSKDKKILIPAAIALGVLLGLVGTVEGFTKLYSDKIFPGVYIQNHHVGGKTKDEALQIISAITPPSVIILAVSGEPQQSFTIETNSFKAQIDQQSTVDQALAAHRVRNRIQNVLTILKADKTTHIPLLVTFDEKQLEETLSVIAGQVAIEPVYPSAKIAQGGILIDKGKKGQDINLLQLKNDIVSSISGESDNQVEVSLLDVDPTLTESQAESYRKRAEKFIGKTIIVEQELNSAELTDSDLVSVLTPTSFTGVNRELLKEKVQTVAKVINREPQNSVFVFEEGKVKEFTPSVDGLLVNESELLSLLEQKIAELENSDQNELVLQAPVAITPAEIRTSDVNNLGIKELIGRGTSKFKGSIPSRVHNVALATSRINGTLIKPGESFSFNQALGDVSKLTGYKEAYVIKDGKTVLGDGGGVCQVSTTVFRAALSAGLPITERRGHSYRVGYYEQDAGPGLDATIYAPTTDLKIHNDTPGHILIQAQADTKNMTLTFDIYGTSDGRVATYTKPVMTNVSAPPPDLYQDDPTLPTGVVRQVEHKAWGGKSTFDYEVKKGDQVVYQKTFVTNYRPWQAVYLRGTGPAQ